MCESSDLNQNFAFFFFFSLETQMYIIVVDRITKIDDDIVRLSGRCKNRDYESLRGRSNARQMTFNNEFRKCSLQLILIVKHINDTYG